MPPKARSMLWNASVTNRVRPSAPAVGVRPAQTFAGDDEDPSVRVDGDAVAILGSFVEQFETAVGVERCRRQATTAPTGPARAAPAPSTDQARASAAGR
jgi:hypothetical protein